MNQVMNAQAMPVGTIITLKEITDALGVRHDKSLAKIEKLAKEPSFGAVSFLDIVYNEHGQKTRTMALTKKQAIATGAKLDNANLMKVIDVVESKGNQALLASLNDQIEKAKMLFQVQEIMGETITDHDRRITNLEQNVRMESWQEKALLDAKNRKVYELANGNEKLANKLHRNIWREFKKRFHIPRYSELKQGKFNDGLTWLETLTIDMVV